MLRGAPVMQTAARGGARQRRSPLGATTGSIVASGFKLTLFTFIAGVAVLVVLVVAVLAAVATAAFFAVVRGVLVGALCNDSGKDGPHSSSEAVGWFKYTSEK